MNDFINATNKQLEDSSESREHRAFRFAGLVILGLVSEVAIAIAHPAYDSFWDRWGSVFADVLVAVGVAGEVLFGRMGHRRDAELQKRSKKLLAEANERAAKAELETEWLKSQFAWRRLSPDSIKLISDTLDGFQKMSVMITFVGNDPESNNFSHELGTVFKKNGWKFGFTSGSFAGAVTFGVIIAQPSSKDEIAACAAVRTAASKAGVKFFGGFIPQWFMGSGSGESVASPCAQIYVGPKPMPTTMSAAITPTRDLNT
jgi:hypothetical protein